MNTDLSRGNGIDTYTVSVGTPIDDVLSHYEETYSDRLMLIEDLRNCRAIIEEATHRAVYAAREDGASWSEVAACLGVTKQAAQQRYGSNG
jgi:hypothetical protein